MKICYLFIFSVLSQIICFREWWENSKALELKTDDFFDYIGHEKYVIVKFYTKWCRYCRLMSEDYEKLYDKLKKTRKDIVVSRIEGDANYDISGGYGISSYPKVALFLPGSTEMAYVYQGQRTFENFLEWVDEYAPKLIQEKEESLKMLEDEVNTKKPEKKEEGKKVEMVIAKVENNTEVNTMIDFVKEELILLHKKIDDVSKNFNELKAKRQAKEVEITINPKALFSSYSTFDFVFVTLIIFIMIAAISTAKKIYNKL